MITRSELKKLVERRLRDAHVLINGRRYESAYYIAGYAVECAIKACIAKQFKRNTIPDRRLVNETYKHDSFAHDERSWDVIIHYDPCRPRHCGGCKMDPCAVRSHPFASREPFELIRATREDETLDEGIPLGADLESTDDQ